MKDQIQTLTYIVKQIQGSVTPTYKKIISQLFKKYKVPPVPVKFVNRTAKGSGVYRTYKYKGTKKNIPEDIIIYRYDEIKDHVGEIAHVVGHEMAHHIINIKSNSLRHSNNMYNLADKLGSEFVKLYKKMSGGNSEEKQELKDKIQYWKKNGKEIAKEHEDAGLPPVNIDLEIKKMEKKLKSFK